MKDQISNHSAKETKKKEKIKYQIIVSEFNSISHGEGGIPPLPTENW